MNIFITGTDTGVGKTLVTAGIAAVMQSLGYDTAVYKPFQSGCLNRNGFYLSPDLQFVKSVDPNIRTKCTYNFIPPVAPALAAEMEGIEIQTQEILYDYQSLKDLNEFVLVEGAGGLLCPVGSGLFMSDIAKLLKLPIIIVARPDLGTINHTLLTIQTAQNLGIEVRGVIINRFPTNTEDHAIKTAPEYISNLSGVEILGILPEMPQIGNTINPEIIVGETLKNIDVQKIFNLKIPKLASDI